MCHENKQQIGNKIVKAGFNGGSPANADGGSRKAAGCLFLYYHFCNKKALATSKEETNSIKNIVENCSAVNSHHSPIASFVHVNLLKQYNHQFQPSIQTSTSSKLLSSFNRDSSECFVKSDLLDC